MEQLPRLQARISSLRELRDLVRALRALAASHVREAQGALIGIRRYVEIVEDAIVEGAGLLPKAQEHEAADQRPGTGVLIVVCSEHGFAGAFNERLLDRAEAERKAGQELVIIGGRGTVLASERGLEVDHSFPMATHVTGVVGVTRRVSEYLSNFSTADVVFGSYRKGGNFEPEARNILPLDPSLLVGPGQRGPPLHHLAQGVLLQQLANEYLFAEITRSVMESLASENGSRLRAMETTDHNIGDKLEGLRRSENALRQEAITSELLDIVTGVEAISGGRHG